MMLEHLAKSVVEVCIFELHHTFHLFLVVILDYALDILVLPGIVRRMKDDGMHVSNRSPGDVGSRRQVTNSRKRRIDDIAHVFERTRFEHPSLSEDLSEDVTRQRIESNDFIRFNNLGEIRVEFPLPTVHLRQHFCQCRC